MPEVVTRLAADEDSLRARYSIAFSLSALDRFTRFYKEQQEALESLPFATFCQEDKVDYLLMQAHIRHELNSIELQRRNTNAMLPLMPYAAMIDEMAAEKFRLRRPDAERAAKRLTEMTEQIRNLDEKLEKSPQAKPSPVIANRAVIATERLQETLHDWYKQYVGYDPQFTWWVELPYKYADAAITQHVSFLKEKVIGIAADDKTTIIGEPVGRPELLDELAESYVPYTPEELIQVAQKEYDWCMRQMLQASHEMGYGDDWHAAVDRVKQMHVSPGEQPEVIRKLVQEGIDFANQKELVSIPPLAEETWRMVMMTPERQLVNPFFTGGNEISVSYPTDTMIYEQREMSMRGNATPLSHATAFHEMIPGHFLQQYMSARYNTYRNEFATPFWHEGNAMWWEMLYWDLGYNTTPAERVGALVWRMHRSARIIFTMNFHLGRWTPQQCVEFLNDKVGFEPENSLAEVRRSFDGSVGPLYQIAYLTGALQFRALHHELVDSGKMTNREFHDAVLHENAMPVELLRADLENLPLSRQYQTNWKFYDDIPRQGVPLVKR